MKGSKNNQALVTYVNLYKKILTAPQTTKTARDFASLFGFLCILLGLFTLIMGIYSGMVSDVDLAGRIILGLITIFLGYLFLYLGAKILSLNFLK